MTEARIVRETTVVPISGDTDDAAARIAREGTAVAHHFPEASTNLRMARLGVFIAISRPHGWDVFDDPAL